ITDDDVMRFFEKAHYCRFAGKVCALESKEKLSCFVGVVAGFVHFSIGWAGGEEHVCGAEEVAVQFRGAAAYLVE
ncbi:MAG: hypothetical protein MN733_23510, partial [Nitrososphaera sp.]|nr:hypothetical protein [Nitrososphaera sp.]